MSKYIDLAKKLKALADRGVGVEKQNAERMLRDLLNKHNISLEDIEEEKLTDRYFNVKPNDLKLFAQVVKRTRFSIQIAGPIPKSKMKYFQMEGNFIAVEITNAEYIEINAKYDFFKRLLAEEYEIFFHAFCEANDLLAQNTDAPDREFTEEEIQKYVRIREMSKRIKKGHFNTQIE